MPPTESGGGAVSLMARAGFQLALCGYGAGLSFPQDHKAPTCSAQKLKPEIALVLGMDFPFPAMSWVREGQEQSRQL